MSNKILARAAVVAGLTRPRTVPQPKPPSGDLLAESAQRADVALLAAEAIPSPAIRISGQWREYPTTSRWPDPYGPDEVVFGPCPWKRLRGPRVKPRRLRLPGLTGMRG